MMKTKFPNDLVIRTAVVRNAEVGYILAADPKLEEKEVTHTDVFKWDRGDLIRGSLNFNAHTCCLVSMPEFAMVMLAGFGEYGITTKQDKLAGNIFEGKPKRVEYGAFRLVTEIGGKAYAAGLKGMVYQLNEMVKWVRIDKGLPDSFNITAIDGFSASDIYAAGYAGTLWHFDGQRWLEVHLPTKVNLTSLKCVSDGSAYIGGYEGTFLVGSADSWDVVATDLTGETFWDIEWFNNELYLSTMHTVYNLQGNILKPVDFGEDRPETCYHLSVAEGVMWSIGAKDIMSFDGEKWTRIV